MSFIYYNPNPLGKHTGDCVIRAITKLLNATWYDVSDDLYEYSRTKADMQNANDVWQSYIELLGYKKHKIQDLCPFCYSVEEFCKDHPFGKYILAVAVNYRDYFNTAHSGKPIGNHVVCVEDGKYYDTWNSGKEVPIYYWQKGV